MRTSNLVYAATLNGLPINADANKNLGCHLEILTALESVLRSMLQRHSRIFVTMLTVRLPEVHDGPYNFSVFLESFIRHERHYYGDVKYVWRVECNPGTVHPHWHVVLVYDGNRTRSAWKHQQNAMEYWEHTLGTDAAGLIHVTRTRSPLSCGDGFMIPRGEMDNFRDCFHFCSYIAKVGNNMLPENTRAFGRSVQ